MNKLTLTLLAAGLAVAASTAQAAEEWGIAGEKVSRFEAKVVDVACELSGNCPANCGGGKRQLGLLKDDGTLLLAAKNADPFAGTAHDLLPFCGQRIVADGLLIANKHLTMFALQFKRPAPKGQEPGPWAGATWFTRDWVKAHGGDGSEWFRKDPVVAAEIKEHGKLGRPDLKLKPQ